MNKAIELEDTGKSKSLLRNLTAFYGLKYLIVKQLLVFRISSVKQN